MSIGLEPRLGKKTLLLLFIVCFVFIPSRLVSLFLDIATRQNEMAILDAPAGQKLILFLPASRCGNIASQTERSKVLRPDGIRDSKLQSQIKRAHEKLLE